jgi:hypothetical protein
MRLWFLGLIFIFAFVAQPARADALLAKALAPASEDMQRSWTVQRTGLDYDANGHLKSKTISIFNGAEAPGKRWQLISYNGGTPSKAEQAEFQDNFKNNALPPCYAMLGSIVPPSAAKLDENATEARYRVAQMPAGTTTVKGIDLSKYTVADVIVDKRSATPFIREVRVFAPKTFRPIPGSKVTKLERVLRFDIGKDGVPLLIEHSMTSDASVMFKSITVRSMAQFSHQETMAKVITAGIKASR